MIQSLMQLLIFPILILSPFISISMNSWFSIWMMLELNMMSFIPIIIFFNKFYKESSLKYFIIQSASSTLIIFFSSMMFNNYNFYNSLIYIMNLAILIKLGASPFHNWFINIMNNLNWMNCMILSIWQKIIPLILLTYNFCYKLLILSALMSSMISCMMGNNHQSIRMIMSYSSINHLSWMLMNLLISENMLILYFMLYMILNSSIMIIFMNYKMFYINNIINLKLNKVKFFLMLNMLSMASLPPFMGFMMKWSSIIILINKLNLLFLLIMMIMSILSFLFYIRIILSLTLSNKIILKINMLNKNFNINNLNYITMILLISSLNLWILNNWII